MEPRNRFQRINSASLCSLAVRYDNPIPSWFLDTIDRLKVPAQTTQKQRPNSRTKSSKKELRVFLLAMQHSQTQTHTSKGDRRKTDRKPYPIPYGLRNPYKNLKSENSQDYARHLNKTVCS